MATTYSYDRYDPEQERVIESGSIKFTGASTVIPATLNQVSPVGTITSGSLPTATLSSGTGAQISTARDAAVDIAITSDGTNNAATCAVALSPDNSTYSTLYTLSIPAALANANTIVLPVHVRVPAGWYIKVTVSHFAITSTTYS